MVGILEAFAFSIAASFLSAGLTYALTPTQKIEGNRLKDLTSGTSSYGSSLPWAWGTVRLPGNKIWLDYLEERRKTETHGGGFFGLAPKVETTTYNYFGYWAEVYCECPFRPAVRLQRSWMNKKLVYSTVGGAETIAKGGKFAQEYLRFYKGEPAQAIDPLLQNKQPISSYSYGIPTDTTERDAYLSSLGIDPNTVIFTPAYNHRAISVWQRVPLGDFFNAIPAGEGELVASENCTVSQIVGDIFSLFYEPTRYDTSLLTTPVQGFTIDSVGAAKSAIQTLQQAYFFDIVDSNGVYKFIPLNHPRDVINLRIEDLAAHTGEQKPVDYEIIEADPQSLPSKVTVQYIDPDLNYDVNQQDSSLEVKGHYNPNPVQLSFNLILTASEAATIADRALILAWIAKYTYKFKLPPAYLGLEPADLIANVFDDRNLPIRLTRLRLGANLIIDAEGTAHEVFFWNLVRQLETGGVTLGVADYNVILEISGTPTAVADKVGNIYTEGTDYTVNESGNIQIIESGNIASGTELVVSTTKPPEPDPVSSNSTAIPTDTELLVLDIPLISNDDPDYTIYITGDGTGSWNGAAIYLSTDDTQYTYAGELSIYGIFGTAITSLDRDGVLTVQVNRPELESITDSDIVNGYNLALVSNKIVQFKTAELTDVNTYRLKIVATGLRGTETQPDPEVGSRFVLLTGNNANLASLSLTELDIGEVRYFKAVSPGQSVPLVEPVQITYQGIAQRPYAPVNLAAIKNRSGDITITWDRRDRKGSSPGETPGVYEPRHDQKNNPPILSEDLEEYIIRIKNQTTIVRDVTTNTKSYAYLATEQLSDFGAVQSTITVEVAQVSSDVVNGSFATAVLTPELVEPQPTITSFDPPQGEIGTTIAIVGTNLGLVTEVKIGDIVQNNLAIVDNENISFRVAVGTVSGKIQLTTAGGTTTSGNALIVEIEQTSPGHYIQDDTTTYIRRANLKFTGNVTVTDSEATETTIVEITGNTPDNANGSTGTFGESTHTTANLENGEFGNVDLELPAVTVIRQIEVSKPCRIRLFGTDRSRTEDTADINTQLTEASGLILDRLFNSTYQFARGIIAQNCDDPVANFIYAKIGNNSGTAQEINVGIKYYAIANLGKDADAPHNSSFDPIDIEGLLLWLDATDNSTLTLNGTDVTNWADKSRQSNDVSVAPGRSSPTYSNNEIVFDGSNGLEINQPRFLGNAPRYIAFSVKVNFSSRSQWLYRFGEQSADRHFGLAWERNNNLVLNSWSSNDVIGTTGALQDNTYAIIETIYDGSIAKVLINQNLYITKNFAYNTSNSATGTIGSLPGFNDNLTGAIKEFIVYARVLSEQDRNNAYKYMAAKSIDQ